MDPGTPSREAVRLEVARIGGSTEFKNTPRLREFLQFITDETLAGREEQIKEYSIGVSVYRKGASYDPRLDATVRVEAAKLRTRLSSYYEQSGKDDPVRVSMPKGGYVPKFETILAAALPALENLGTRPSIAVLPFLNLSPDAEDEYIADGLVEELTAALTRSGLMRVAPRTAAFRFKGTRPELDEVRRILKVDRVLEGSVRKAGGQLRISVQLIDIPGCSDLWSRAYLQTSADVFSIQAEIAREVISLVCGIERHPASIYAHTPKAAAFDLYLRGRHLVHRWDVNAEEEAIRLFEEAIALDPDYPLPYLGVAAALDCLACMGSAPPVNVLPRAEVALARALQLDPGSAEAHAARATVMARYEWDWVGAEREYRLAIQLAPTSAQAHHEYATELLAPSGRYGEAHAESRRARELDPFSPAIASGYPWILFFQRRFVESEQEFRRLLASGAVYEAERIGVVFALMGQGKYWESLDELQIIACCFPPATSDCIHTWILALAKETDEARNRLIALEELSQRRYVPAHFLAMVHLSLGSTGRGFELLDRAFTLKERALRSMRETFDWDPFRADPRFQALLRRVWPDL